MAAAVAQEDIGEEAESKLPFWVICCVCLEVPTSDHDNVRILPCLHLVCSNDCLKEIKTSGVQGKHSGHVLCKTCKVRHPETQVKASAFVQECQERERAAVKAKNFKHPICSYCIRGDNAISWCPTCQEHMCPPCHQHHGFATKTRDHVTEAVEQKVVTADIDTVHLSCQLHENERITMFCSSCNVMLCNLCCIKRHTGHDTGQLRDFAQETKTSLEGNIKKLESVMCKYEQMENILNHKAQQMMKTQYDYLVTEASAQLARLLSALMKREMEQRQEMIDVVALKSKELNAKRIKIRTIMAQTHHFLEVSKDLLKDGSDWAMVSNKQALDAQLKRLVETADHYAQPGRLDEYTERGFNFVMDKSVGHQAERHINMTAKLSYSYNPKAPPEIKMSGPGMLNRGLRSTGFPVNGSKNVNNANSLNKSKVMIQKTADAIVKSYAKTPKKEVVNQVLVSPQAAVSSARQSRTPRKSTTAASLAELMVSSNSASSVVDQYPNLKDQLIIEPVDADEDSDIEDEVPMSRKSDGEETDVVQDANDDQGKNRESKRRGRRGRKKSSKSASSTNAPRASTSKSLQMKNDSKLGENEANSGSESEGNRNVAPNLSPEPMKTPPKLRRVAESLKSESLGGEDAEYPIDAPPPVLLPSVSIPDGKTAGVRADGAYVPLRRYSSASNLNISAPSEASVVEPEFEPNTRRSRRKSGVFTRNLLPDDDYEGPGPSTGRRGSVTSEISEASDAQRPGFRRGRSKSRSRMEAVPSPPVVDLPSKRERKKKTDPQFVEASLISKKRSRSSPKESGTPPTPNTSASTPSAGGSESKRGRPKGSNRGRRRKSVGRPRKNVLASDAEDDFVAADVLDFPLVREDRMRIEGNNAEDDNEDYCNVCQDGGDGDLLCCDCCPKVYHLKCHIPAIDQVPEGDWQCLFCKSREEVVSLPESVDTSCPPGSLQNRNTREFMISCKFLCEMFSIQESSFTRTFFETVYRLTNKRLPSSLNVIRSRLTLMTPSPYGSFNEVVDDLRLMFRQAYEFYLEGSNEQVQTQVFETKFLTVYQEYAHLIETASTDSQDADESDPLA